eukprot:snap_masked-scaffold_8-processed-gene-13.47-mRNA-1 protein AED:1.00 eAED:1.00 QI:0/0/0/0/1/1/3/0/230
MTKCKARVRMTSREVFDSFTYRNQSGELMHENIFSKECFEHWVRARSSKPKHPEGAFRRTIHAHLRAADGRNPFEKDVEKSLMKKLRSVNIAGKQVDPFSVIFGKEKRFRKNGKGGWHTEFKYPYSHHEKYINTDEDKNILNSRKKLSPYSKLEDQEKNIEHLLHISKQQMAVYANEAEKGSFHFSFPAVAYLVHLLSTNSFFLSKEFILPTAEKHHFKDNCIILYFYIV